MRLRLALVGYGYWGRNLLRTFSSLSEVEVCAVVDPDPAAAAAAAGEQRRPRGAAPTSVGSEGGDRSFDDVCADRSIDAMAIATPLSTHYELARRVLEAGKHCWVEKPLALRLDHARELVDLAGRSRRVLFVDETFLYDPLVRTAREWIQGGRLGALKHLSFERTNMGRIRRDSDVWWNSAPHDLAILRYFTDAGVRSFRADRFFHLQPGVADICTAALELDGGVSVHVYLSWLSPVKAASVVAVGERGMLRYEGRFGQRSLTFFEYRLADAGRNGGSSVIPIERFEAVETVPGGDDEPLSLAARAFIESIRRGVPAPSDGSRSLRVVELLERGDRAAGR